MEFVLDPTRIYSKKVLELVEFFCEHTYGA